MKKISNVKRGFLQLKFKTLSNTGQSMKDISEIQIGMIWPRIVHQVNEFIDISIYQICQYFPAVYSIAIIPNNIVN